MLAARALGAPHDRRSRRSPGALGHARRLAMPRVAEGPDKYLPRLTAARADAKSGTIVNATGFARATGATWRIVERWILNDPAFPVVQRGAGGGTPWQFDLAKALDHLIVRARSLAAGREARSADMIRLAGFGGADGVTPSPAGPAEPGSAADRGADARALKALSEAQMTTHRLKQMQGEYVRANDVRALLAELMTTMQTETLAISSSLDPAGQWAPELRVGVEDGLRTVLVTVRDRMDRRLTEWNRRDTA